MRFPGFVDAVSRRSGLPPEQAAAIARAVVATMAERVTGAAADDPLGRLPDDLGGYLTGPPADPDDGPTTDPAAGSTVDLTAGPGGPSTVGKAVDGGAPSPAEFLRRVGERAGVDPATARVGTGAVFATLREAVTVGEFQQLVTGLPESFDGPAGPDAYDDGDSSATRPSA